MARAFKRRKGGYVAGLSGEERAILSWLMSQVLDLLDPPGTPEPDSFEQMLSDAGLAVGAPTTGGGEAGLPGGVVHPGEPGEVGKAGEPGEVVKAGEPGEVGEPPAVEPAAVDGAATADLDDPHRDPALDRLLPDAHRDDPLLAAEFRRLVGPGLRETKAATLAAAIEAMETAEGERLELDDEQARVFAIALTDVRLVVGERLGLRDDDDAQRLEFQAALGQMDEERAWLLAVYDFLTWLQESLTTAMLRGLR